MEGQRIRIVVHLNITVVLTDRFTNAFYTETMFMLIHFVGDKAALGIGERIFSAGIYDGYHHEWSFASPHRTDFNVSFRNACGSFHCIVQQVAEQGSEIAVGNKVDCFMAYIYMERNLPAVSKLIDCRCFLMS